VFAAIFVGIILQKNPIFDSFHQSASCAVCAAAVRALPDFLRRGDMDHTASGASSSIMPPVVQRARRASDTMLISSETFKILLAP
jgi:hypothetical protein